MSAVVIPEFKVEARTRRTGAWLTACMECEWFPDKYFDKEIATQDGLEHNRVRHEGAGVEFRTTIALDHAVDHERHLATTLRFNQRITIGIVLLYGAGMALIWQPLVGVLFVLYGAILHEQSARVGRWQQRLEEHSIEVTQMRLLLREADDGSEG